MFKISISTQNFKNFSKLLQIFRITGTNTKKYVYCKIFLQKAVLFIRHILLYLKTFTTKQNLIYIVIYIGKSLKNSSLFYFFVISVEFV